MSRDWSKEADACDEFLLSTYEDYSVDTVAELLLPSGLLIDKSMQYVGTFEKYVFLNGNKDEVYNRQEIDFISAIGDIIVFTGCYKETRRGLIPYRVVAVRNIKYETLPFCISFTKIINKASDGFNICVIVAEDGIIFTCRAYDDYTPNAYYISDFIRSEEQLAELYDDLMYSSDYIGFIEYYSYITRAIRYRTESTGVLPKLRDPRRPSYAYIEELQEIEVATGLDFSWEIERCFWDIEEEHKETFEDKVSEADEYLFKIESTQINTMEMLFEAEEREKLALEVEQTMFMQNAAEEQDKTSDIDTETKALLEDPELMIEFLKKKRGI